MASTIETTVNSLPSGETEAAPEPARTSRGRRVAIWAMAAAAIASVGALTVAVVGNDTGDGAPSAPVFTEHSQLHAVDEDTPVADGPVFTEHGQIHGNGDEAPVDGPSPTYPLGGPSITRDEAPETLYPLGGSRYVK